MAAFLLGNAVNATDDHQATYTTTINRSADLQTQTYGDLFSDNGFEIEKKSLPNYHLEDQKTFLQTDYFFERTALTSCSYCMGIVPYECVPNKCGKRVNWLDKKENSITNQTLNPISPTLYSAIPYPMTPEHWLFDDTPSFDPLTPKFRHLLEGVKIELHELTIIEKAPVAQVPQQRPTATRYGANSSAVQRYLAALPNNQ